MTTLKQLSFSGGELAPSLYGRVDQSKYQTGLRTLRNFIIMRHGGATNRPGTEFIAEVKDSTKTVRFIPFVFNSSQTYILEFGNQYMRVYRNGAQLLESAKTITNITNANPAVVTSASHGYSNGDEVYISGIVGDIGDYLNGRNFKVAGVTTNTFNLQYMDSTNVNSTSFGSYSSAGTAEKVYQITTTYLEADLATLNFVQSADVITIVHPTYPPRELTRTGHTSWTISNITFAPETSAPTGVTNSSAGSSGDKWVVTTIDGTTFEESLASSETESSAAATSGAPITISWTGVSGASEYNVYKVLNGIYGFIGIAGGTSFIDNGIDPDTTVTPPTARNPFSTTNDYPSAVAYIQQRLTMGNTNNNPESVWTSRIGQFKNFTVSSPLQADDAVTFSMVGKQVNSVKHLLDLGKFLVLTSGGEWAIQGDEAGILKPTDVNAKQNSYNGSSDIAPIIVGNSALYVQARGSIIKDLIFDLQENGYRGNDLTIFSAHLFDGYTIVDWAYQQIPHSIVWVVRSDGVLLGLTYIREHQVWGWHRHDTNGTVENVSVIPEGNEDAVYLCIKRTINSKTVRYIEKMTTRRVSDVIDNIFVDSSLSYDGRNTNTSHTMTLSGGSTWAYDETLTLTSNISYFASTDVNKAIHLTGSDGTIIRFEIETYSTTQIVTGKPHKTVPASMRSANISNWAKAIKEIGGLWHLEGETVSVYADRFVVANPNNAAYTSVTVTNGTISLSESYTVIHIGLPYISDIETLDIDTAQGESIIGKFKKVSEVSMSLEASRGVWVGAKPPTDDDTDPLEGLNELKIREEESYDDPVSLLTDTAHVMIDPDWNSNGRVFIRQIDPIPLTILSIAPSGDFPFSGGG